MEKTTYECKDCINSKGVAIKSNMLFCRRLETAIQQEKDEGMEYNCPYFYSPDDIDTERLLSNELEYAQDEAVRAQNNLDNYYTYRDLYSELADLDKKYQQKKDRIMKLIKEQPPIKVPEALS